MLTFLKTSGFIFFAVIFCSFTMRSTASILSRSRSSNKLASGFSLFCSHSKSFTKTSVIALKISSLEFWQSDIGHLCSENFNAVTADTFHYLIQYSHKIRSRNEVTGYKVFYSAYGYHGSEIFINCKLQWQTFIPYLQGHAKKKLEFYAKEAAASKIKTTVFNCPEICSKSSKGFKGGEIPLFLLLKAFQQIYPSHWSNEQFAICQNKLKSNVSLKKY